MIDTDIMHLRDKVVKIRQELYKHLPHSDDMAHHQLCRAIDHLRDTEALLHQACGTSA